MEWVDLYDRTGKKVNLETFGLIGLKLSIPSPSYEVETETLEGVDGEIVIEQRLLPRPLSAAFWSKSADYEDSLQKRNDIFAFLGGGKELFVAESRNPGRRWLVRMGSWDPNRINSRVQEFEIPLIAKSGKSETQNVISRNFTKPNFSFKNEGEKIDMRKQSETEIEFRGASDNLTITNKTTGDEWKYNGSSTVDDVILLKGVRSLKKGSSIFGDTNHKLISFAPGWNDFEVSGAEDFTLTIRTRFYFL